MFTHVFEILMMSQMAIITNQSIGSISKHICIVCGVCMCVLNAERVIETH